MTPSTSSPFPSSVHFHKTTYMHPFPNSGNVGLWEVILHHLSEISMSKRSPDPMDVAERGVVWGVVFPIGCPNKRWDVTTCFEMFFLMSRWSGDPPKRATVLRQRPWPQRPHGQIHIAHPNHWWLCWGPKPCDEYDQIRLAEVGRSKKF